MRRLAAVATLAVLLPAAAPGAECAPGRITLVPDDGAAVTYEVEIADEPAERSRGLMYRTDLPRGQGMLFLWERAAPRSFWMRNTPLPLDILFIDETGRVLNVAARTTPYSESPIPSEGDALAVLEINGGLAAEQGIGPGTQAVHPAFVAAPVEHRCPAE